MLVEAVLRRMWRKSHSLILNITEDRSLSYMIILLPKKKVWTGKIVSHKQWYTDEFSPKLTTHEN